MTLAADRTQSENEREPMVQMLRNQTALGRISHTEAHDIFNVLGTLGYTVTKTAPAPTAAPAAVKA